MVYFTSPELDAWMQHLRGRGLEEDFDSGDYEAWHTLRMLCLVRPG